MDTVLGFVKNGTVVVLFVGVLAYAWLLIRAYFLGKKSTKTMLERSPAHNFGLPFSAVASFGLVTLLDAAVEGNLDFKAFGLEFSGPSAPLTLWVVCYITFVWSIKKVEPES